MEDQLIARTETIDWLLSGDPSISWQVKKDLLGLDKEAYDPDRHRIAREGWGRQLLDRREPDGRWGGGIYSPKWISTHYTLMLLWRLGLAENNAPACESIHFLLDKGLYHDGGINYFKSMRNSETCVTGMTLSLCCGFDIPHERFKSLPGYLLREQLEDGGWNCELYRGARHSSMHTTISVLEGLWAYENKFPYNSGPIRKARLDAHEFLLRHRLFRSDHTGEVINTRWTRMPFPPRWYYDTLRALDYFRNCDAGHDDRFKEAIELLRNKEKEGKWPLNAGYSGRVFFVMEKAGQPSRWNTLRALRVMNWRKGC